MPTITAASSSTVALLRLERAGMSSASAEPDQRDHVEQHREQDQYREQSPVAGADRAPAVVHVLPGHHRGPPPRRSTSSSTKIRNRYSSEKANIRRALRSVSSRH